MRHFAGSREEIKYFFGALADDATESIDVVVFSKIIAVLEKVNSRLVYPLSNVIIYNRDYTLIFQIV